MKISVCLCTYKRAFLRNTLESLACQILPVDTTLEVIVVDNDQEKTAEKIIDDISRDYPFDIKYFSEPEKNIATARNKSIEMATGEWLAFIDDDEEADSNWISQLLNTAKKYQADFVQGPVIPIYPKSTPTWIKEGDYFGRRNLVTGTEIDCGAAGNGLLYSQWVKDGLRFNKEFGLTGGEDGDFFIRLYKKGGRLIWSNEANVLETVENNRLNEKYLTKRALRIGETFIKVRKPYMKLKEKLAFFLITLLKLFLFSVLAVLLLPTGKANYFKYYLKLVDCFGKIRSSLSIEPVEIYRIKSHDD